MLENPLLSVFSGRSILGRGVHLEIEYLERRLIPLALTALSTPLKVSWTLSHLIEESFLKEDGFAVLWVWTHVVMRPCHGGASAQQIQGGP